MPGLSRAGHRRTEHIMHGDQELRRDTIDPGPVPLAPGVGTGGLPLTPDGMRSLRQAATRTALAGIVHSVLFLLSFYLLSTVPGAQSPNEEVVEFYASGDQRRVVLVGLYLMPFAGVAFMWFIVSLRTWIGATGAREEVLLSNMQLVSGIVFTTLFFAAAAATSITAASVQYVDAGIDPVVARQFPLYGRALLLVFAIRMAAIFVITTTSIGRATRLLPTWFVVTGYALGAVLLLSVSFSRLLVLAFPAWVFVLSLLLLHRARQLPVTAPR
jgi:hypothetical protein